MPTPQLLAYRRVLSRSGSAGISLALPDYAPGYEWDDWFVVLGVKLGLGAQFLPSAPWSGPSLASVNFQDQRFYNNDNTGWTLAANGATGAVLAYMFAFRNGGQASTDYAIGGGSIGGSPTALHFTRYIVPALPQDAIAVLLGLAAHPVGSTYEANTPVIASRVIYDHGEITTVVDDDANLWAMWTDVQPAGTTYPTVFDPTPPTFAPCNWGTDAEIYSDALNLMASAWWFVDYAPNPAFELPPMPPAVGACPDHGTAQARAIPHGVRVVTDAPVVVAGGTATVRATVRV